MTFTAFVSGNAFDTGTDIVNLIGSTGNETLTGTSIAAVISGGAGVDIITGGAGADTITGGAGADSMTGGGGVDVFSYGVTVGDLGTFAGGAAATGADVITDFTAGNGGDVLRFANALIGDGNGTFTTSSLATAGITGALSEVIIGTEAFADTAAVIAAIKLVTNTTGTLFVVFVTDIDEATGGSQSATQVWYDANPDFDGGEYVVATLTGITTIGGHAGMVSANVQSGG
jgi:hypothetical protein